MTVVEQTPSRMQLEHLGRQRGRVPRHACCQANNLDAERASACSRSSTSAARSARIDTEISSLQSQQSELDQRVEETRSSLHAIQKDPRAAASAQAARRPARAVPARRRHASAGASSSCRASASS